MNGTCASELRTRFCPMRFTYSVITGSRISFDVASTSWAYCLPMRISPSSEYQSPSPRPPTLRLPMAFTSFLLPSCFTLLSSGCATTVGSFFGGVSFPSASVGVFAVGSEGAFAVGSEGVFAVGSAGAGVDVWVGELGLAAGLSWSVGVSVFWSGVPCFTEGAESSLVFLESCWANAGTINNSAERTTAPGERRNFMTNSCPGPGPHLQEIIRPVECGTPNDSHELDAERTSEVIWKAAV